MKILLTEWAARHYSPAPSDWTLRRIARDGQIYPPPEKVGREWYVDENAKRLTAARVSLVERLGAV
jgi:predicted site-specific integrase-resolvase